MKHILFQKIIRKLRGRAYSAEELRSYGVRVGENCYIGTRHIDVGHGFLIEIGNDVTISSARILTHDASTKRALGYSKVGKVVIGDGTFVGAGAIILPGVRIGKNVIIGAGAVVAGDIPDNSVAVGNPAQVICTTEDYLAKCRSRMTEKNTWNTFYTDKTDQEKREMKQTLEEIRIGFDV